MSSLWDPLDLPGIVSVQTEAMGKKEKYWVELSNGSHWLVKLVRARQVNAANSQADGVAWWGGVGSATPPRLSTVGRARSASFGGTRTGSCVSSP
jgi:hypothetical protein